MAKILYFSHVNWSWIKQRPHFVSSCLANKGFNVTFFYLKSITSFIANVETGIVNENTESNLKIRTSKVLPFGYRNKFINKINTLLIRYHLKENFDIIILTHPYQIDYLMPKLAGKKLIYDCMDNYPCFYNNPNLVKIIKEKEKRLCENASQIIVSSNELRNELISRYKLGEDKVKVVFNALDDDCILSSNFEKVQLKTPNLIYVGTIGDWIDFDDIYDFAQNNLYYTIYLVGPIEKGVKKIIKQLPENVVIVGAVEHKNVFSYIIGGDVMLMPFKVNELIRCVDPVKIYEYIAFNKPIISTYWKELDKFGDKINFNKKGLIYTLNDLKIINYKGINKTFIRKENWKERIKEYLKIIDR